MSSTHNGGLRRGGWEPAIALAIRGRESSVIIILINSHKLWHAGKLPSEIQLQDTYVNVISMPPAFKPASAKTSQLPASTVKTQDKPSFDLINESDDNRRHKEIPPPTASKPKYAVHANLISVFIISYCDYDCRSGIHSDAHMQVYINMN